MIKMKREIFNLLGRIALIVLFFLMINAFSNKYVSHDRNIASHELVSELKSINTKAVAIKPVQLPSFQKDWVSLVDRMNYKLLDKNLKIYTDNLKIKQKSISLQNTELKVKPILNWKYYFQLLSPDPKESPILS